ncbi:hypothetical protein DVH24_015425 [Malus domestica]|uniref:Uncharacterized protein n=1 Tax=Malus domestica TaxID=3750 RepID=A0A498HPM2_MALDO|nr:hypothetical protein DVH24_015425 [Malus domestica]
MWFKFALGENRTSDIHIAWYVGQDGTEFDEAFRPTFGALKTGGMRCSLRRNLDEFLFHLTPWNDLFHIRGTQNYNLNVSFFFLIVSIRGHLCSLSVPSRPVPSGPVPSAYQTIPYSMHGTTNNPLYS